MEGSGAGESDAAQGQPEAAAAGKTPAAACREMQDSVAPPHLAASRATSPQLLSPPPLLFFAGACCSNHLHLLSWPMPAIGARATELLLLHGDPSPAQCRELLCHPLA